MAKGTKHLIERTALTLFVEKGIRETTVRDIAAVAEIAEGTLYRHFASKEDLAEALFTQNYDHLTQQLEEVATSHEKLNDALAAMIKHACAAFDEDWELFSYLLLSQHRHLRQRAPTDPSPANTLHKVISAAAMRGEIPRGDAEFQTAMVLGLVLQTAVFVVYGRLPRPLSGHADALVTAAGRLLLA